MIYLSTMFGFIYLYGYNHKLLGFLCLLVNMVIFFIGHGDN